MATTSSDADFLTFQRQTLDKSPQDVRAYWTPERKKAAIPAHRYGTATDDVGMPDAANSAPTTDPKQADLSKMPFITGGKLFFTLDGVDYVASWEDPHVRNLLLPAGIMYRMEQKIFRKYRAHKPRKYLQLYNNITN